MATTIASRKARGRNLQQLVCKKILETFPILEPDDVQSRSMGASGTDIMLSPAAKKLIPLAIECKNQEKLALYPSWEQCKANTEGGLEPALVIKKNRIDPLVVITLDYFMSLVRRSYEKEKAT